MVALACCWKKRREDEGEGERKLGGRRETRVGTGSQGEMDEDEDGLVRCWCREAANFMWRTCSGGRRAN